MITVRTAMVVATNRPDSMRTWLEKWGTRHDGRWSFPWGKTIVVWGQEEPDPSFENYGIEQYGYSHIDSELGPHDQYSPISRGDSAIKCYGFYKAVTEHRADLIMSLDDDCYPTDPSDRDIVQGHLDAMIHPKWISSVPGLQVRGVPYRNKGRVDGVMVNMGLWRGVPDLDAVNQLSQGDHGDWEPPGICKTSRLMHPDQFVPFCGMNIAFFREAAPLMYFPRMGEGVPYGRFDDIWCGAISQRICRHLHWKISYGPPIISHDKASNPFRNLVKEAHGIEAHEQLWQLVDRVELDPISGPLACMREIGWTLKEFSSRATDALPGFKEYLHMMDVRIAGWCTMFEKTDWR